MAFVQFNRVSLAFGDRDILKNVSVNLQAGTRAALAGVNGSGKTTLLKVMAGVIQSDSGERAVQKNCRVSWLPQSGIVHRGRTLREEAESAWDHIAALVSEAEQIGAELEHTKNDEKKTAALLAGYQRLHETIENSGYYRRAQAISTVLSGLGFSEDDQERQAEEFSGGWQMRIALAKVLLETPDILLLDEPTNYLDIEARAWLEEWLLDFSGGYLLVSHDRYFLDVTVREVYEIFNGTLKRYAGNYSDYEKTRQDELDQLQKRYTEQIAEIEKTDALIRRFRYKASKAAFAQEQIKRLEKMKAALVEIPESLKKISITFPAPPHSGRVALSLKEIKKHYGERRVIENLDLDLDSGERLVVAGKNGAGKTTLLRIIAGADGDFSGEMKYGSGIAPAYFSQDAAEAISGTLPGGAVQTALDFIESGAPTALIPRIRDMMGAFLFRGDDVYKPVSVLSGGEKSRLALLKILLRPMNLLILDEPTNHLDLYSKDILLETLKKFTGTVIFVSHDRDFMEALSTKTLELRAGDGTAPGSHRLFYGGYAYYLDRLARESAGEVAPVARLDTARPHSGTVPQNGQSVHFKPGNGQSASLPRTILVKAAPPEERATGNAEWREMRKRRQAEIRRLERREAEILGEMEALEKEKAETEKEMSKSENYSSAGKARALALRLEKTAAALEEKTREWEKAASALAETALADTAVTDAAVDN